MLSRLKNKKWNFETGLYYTNKGNYSRYISETEVSNGSGVDYSYTFRTNYLEVPLLLHYNFVNNVKYKTYFLFGPTYSGLIKARREQTAPRIDDIDVKNALQRDDFGISIGIGQSFFFITRWCSFDLRYYHGIRNVNDYDGLRKVHLRKTFEQGEIAKFRNSTINFTFAIGLERNIAYYYK